MATKNQVVGGAFQDALGNPVALGYMLFELSQDAQVNSTTQLGAGRVITIKLDSSGNVAGTQSVWPNDALSPAGTFYNVSVYTANGQLVWGPNAQQVLSTPSPYNIGAWVPSAVNVGLGGSGAGTVTSFSFTNANGFSGTVTNPTTSADLTISQTSLNLPSFTPLTSVEGVGASILSFTGSSGSNTLVQFNGSGTATDSGILVTAVPFLAASNTWTNTNEFNSTVVFKGTPLLSANNATSGVNVNSPALEWTAQWWNTGTSLSVGTTWNSSNVLGTGNNPTTTLTFTSSGSTGFAAVSMPSLILTDAVTATSATAGSATTLPATPTGYVEIPINGTTVKVPYYSI
jgi:hypothetical protein